MRRRGFSGSGNTACLRRCGVAGLHGQAFDVDAADIERGHLHLAIAGRADVVVPEHPAAEPATVE